jgi:hypothetical protein
MRATGPSLSKCPFQVDRASPFENVISVFLLARHTHTHTHTYIYIVRLCISTYDTYMMLYYHIISSIITTTTTALKLEGS